MSATQQDVARRAGVSRALVSLVMRNSPRVAEATRQKVLQAANDLGYRPNAYAARLASHRTMTLGVVLTQMDNPVLTEAFRAIVERAGAAGYGVILRAGVMSNPESERAAVEDLLSFRVDGIVALASGLPSVELRQLTQRLPVAVAFRRVTGVDSVSADERQAVGLLMTHLLELGHRRIAHVSGGNNPGSRSRRAAYEAAMRDAGLQRSLLTVSGGFTESGGQHAAEILLAENARPTAIFAANDLSALGVMATAKRRGIVVPEGLSVAGFDNSMISGLGVIDLTSVDQPKTEMGKVAVDLLLSRITSARQEAEHVLLRPALVVRRTTAAPERG